MQDLETLTDLFTGLPHVMFCVKDTAGRYLRVNQAFADRAGRGSPADVVGCTAQELFPADMAAAYAAQDAAVITSGTTLRNELELILRPDGTVGWYVTTKTPLRDDTGQVTAIASVSVDLRMPADGPGVSSGLAAAVAVARSRCTESLSVAEIAAAAGMSPTQLERAMRRAMGVSPKQLVLRFRLEEAMRRLREGDEPIAQIASECGYYDQSAFTRQFRRVVGMSPGSYRGDRASGPTPW